MKIEDFCFGSLRIDGAVYKDDLLIEGGKVRKRAKEASRKFRSTYGHTPLSAEEEIPWKCTRLIVGTGVDGKMPVLPEVGEEARRRGIEFIVLPTAQAIETYLQSAPGTTNAVLHITC